MNRTAKWGLIGVLTVGLMTPMLWQGMQPGTPHMKQMNTKSLGNDQVHTAQHRAQAAQIQELQMKKQQGNERVVARDVSITAALCVRDCRIMLTALANELAHVKTADEKAKLLQHHLDQHPQFVSLTLREDGQAPISVGKALRPDLQEQAHKFSMQDRFYVSDLYHKPQEHNPQQQIGMTLGVPIAGDHKVTGTLTADSEMGHLMQVINNQDREMGTNSTLVGMDGKNEMLPSTQRRMNGNGGISTQQATSRTAKSKVDGTGWQVRVSALEAPGTHSHARQVSDEVVTRFPHALTQAEIDQHTKALGAQLVRKNARNAYIFRSTSTRPADMVAYFKKHGAVIAEPHIRYKKNDVEDNDTSTEQPNDYFYGTHQWNLPQIGADRAWLTSTGNPRLTIAVVDTGVDLNHPEFKGKLVDGVNMLNQGAKPQDDNGHGTHVAGIIAARTNNIEGVAGIDWASKIMPVKAMDKDGTGSVVDIGDGIEWAADHGASVINLSLGEYDDSDYLHDAIKYAHSKGCVVVAAMGNDGVATPSYPAAYPEVIAVAADDDNEETASFSNYGPHASVTAPGVAIPSTYMNNRYVALSGTSMASPHVAGVAALVRSINPKLTPEQVRSVLENTADDLGPDGKDDYYGYGQVNVEKAVQAAKASLQK